MKAKLREMEDYKRKQVKQFYQEIRQTRTMQGGIMLIYRKKGGS